ncbi:MAG TPA: hypothetical protein PKD72_12230 [Gemmatales bacterium]|nr:hypothetical protein [Gemmatales bacterium]
MIYSTPADTARNVRVIYFALAGGLIFLLGICLYMISQVAPNGFVAGKAAGPAILNLPFLTLILSVVAIMNLLMSLVLPGTITKNRLDRLGKKQEPPQLSWDEWDTENTSWQEQLPQPLRLELLQTYSAESIMGAALAQSTGIISAVAYLLEAHWLPIVLLFLAIVYMLWNLPTLPKLNHWLRKKVKFLISHRP